MARLVTLFRSAGAPPGVLTSRAQPASGDEERRQARPDNAAIAGQRNPWRGNAATPGQQTPWEGDAGAVGQRNPWRGNAATPGQGSAARSTPEKSTDPKAIELARMTQRGFRRELTDEEYASLTPAQQQQVQFNNVLAQGLDADIAAGGTERRNSEAIISQLGVDEGLEKRLIESLGAGHGPAVTYDDLFGQPQSEGMAKFMAPPTAQPLGDTRSPSGATERQKLVNELSASLEEFLGTRKQAMNTALNQEALARGSEYKFASDQAKADYEESFNVLLARDQLANFSWPAAAQNMQSLGYDPADFQAYVLDRVKMLPKVDGQSTIEDLNSWFGQ